MIQNALRNWKTTFAGLTLVIGDAVHLVFSVINHQSTESIWTASLIGIVGGFGLIVAGDASHSQAQLDGVKTDVATAVQTGNTNILTKPAEGK